MSDWILRCDQLKALLVMENADGEIADVEKQVPGYSKETNYNVYY